MHSPNPNNYMWVTMGPRTEKSSVVLQTGKTNQNPSDYVFYYNGKPLKWKDIIDRFGEGQFEDGITAGKNIYIKRKGTLSPTDENFDYDQNWQASLPEGEVVVIGEKPSNYDENRYEKNQREFKAEVGAERAALNDPNRDRTYIPPQDATMNYISSQINNMQDPIDPERQEQYRKQKQKELISWIPFVGDAVDLYDIGDGLYNRNYGQAALGAVAFVAPEFIGKGFRLIKNSFEPALKQIRSGFNNYKYDIKHFNDTWSAIKKGEYQPLMSPSKKRRLRQEYYDEAYNSVSNVRSLVDLNAKAPVWNRELQDYQMQNVFNVPEGSSFTLPEISIVNNSYSPRVAAWYDTEQRKISIPMFKQHRLIPKSTITSNAFHEGTHDFIQNYSNVLKDFTIPSKEYRTLNPKNEGAVSIFSPLLDGAEVGTWHSSPEEFMAELLSAKGYLNINRPMTLEDKLKLSKFLSFKFPVGSKDIKYMLDGLSGYGFKNGGKLLNKHK